MVYTSSNMENEVGRPTILDEEVFTKIRDCVFKDMNLQEMADAIGIPRQTVYNWNSTNYLDFRKKVKTFEEEYILSLAGFNIKKVLHLDTASQEGKEDPQLLKIQADVSKWAKEHLENDRYNKASKVDVTSGGKPFAFDIAFKDVTS